MSRNELIAKIEALNEWERLIAEAQAEAEAIKDSIKAEMLEQHVFIDGAGGINLGNAFELKHLPSPSSWKRCPQSKSAGTARRLPASSPEASAPGTGPAPRRLCR